MLVLLVGGYKTGKTCSIRDFPKPMRILDFDDGAKSIAALGYPMDGIEIVPMIAEVDSDLGFRTPIEKGGVVGGAPAYSRTYLDLIGKLNTELKRVKEEPPRTLVIDSLTSMFRIWKGAILAVNSIPILRIADYGTLRIQLFDVLVPKLKRLVLNGTVDWIILIDHEETEKDEVTGFISSFPVGPSNSAGREMGSYFDEIWRMEVVGQGKYQWRTKKVGNFQAGSRLNLPDPIPASYMELEKVLIANGYLKPKMLEVVK